MTNRQVSGLPSVDQIRDTDVFVLERDGVARKATGETMKVALGSGSAAADMVVNLSGWYSGTFTVTTAGKEKSGAVEFDADGRPKSVALNGHTVTFTFPEVE